MFARTKRLLLRPGFPEDAQALASAIADEAIVRNLASAPWPYGLRDAQAFLAAPRDPVLPTFLITERTESAPVIVGACGLGRRASGAVELGYWIARPHWGRGIASEAAAGLIEIACALRLPARAGYSILPQKLQGSDRPVDDEIASDVEHLPRPWSWRDKARSTLARSSTRRSMHSGAKAAELWLPG